MPMARAPDTLTMRVPHGKVSPIHRLTKPETKKREMPPKKPPSKTRAQPSRVMGTGLHTYLKKTAAGRLRRCVTQPCFYECEPPQARRLARCSQHFTLLPV